MLNRLSERLWTVEHTLTMSLGVRMPTRMSVVHLADGTVALVSPVPIDDALESALAAIGPVAHVIAPNALHHLNVEAALGSFPEARLWGPKALEKKHPALRFEPLEREFERALGEVLLAVPVEGASKISETVLLHPESKTLVVTDLVFNVVAPPSWPTAVLLTLTGTRGKLAQSRVWSFAAEDLEKARRSCERILGWDFDRLVVAHGDVIESDGRARLAAALSRTGPVKVPTPVAG